MDNDRVGFNVFAGEAYPILPLTGDLTSANFFLDNVNTNMVTLQGTNIASAIKLAYRGFPNANRWAKQLSSSPTAKTTKKVLSKRPRKQPNTDAMFM